MRGSIVSTLAYAMNLATIQAITRDVEAELWAAQLREWPDSFHVKTGEALQWCYEIDRDDVQRSVTYWDSTIGDLLEPNDRSIMRPAHIDMYIAREQLRMSRCVANAMAHDVGIFYQCGKRADGTYAHKGFRYGMEPHEYMSGFTQ